MGGRLEKANVKYDKKHQYIIPSKSRLSYLLLKNVHKQTLHEGVQLMSNYLRSAYWIPKMRQEAKSYSCQQYDEGWAGGCHLHRLGKGVR